MFSKILKALAKIFSSPTMHDSLEAYIVAGNPQNAGDVDRLEREFARRTAPIPAKYY